MPCGRVHNKFSLLMSIPATVIGYSFGHSWEYGLAAGLGCLAGIFLTPDLDQESINTSEYWIIKYTMGLGFFWCMLWYPYARTLKHRCTLSHFPVLSTAIRLAYLSVFLLILYYAGIRYPSVDWMLIFWICIGLLISDTTHYILDSMFGDSFRPVNHPHYRVYDRKGRKSQWE